MGGLLAVFGRLPRGGGGSGVGQVLGIAQIRRNSLQKPPVNLTGVRAQYLLGVTDEQATVLDGARLLGDPDLPVMAD